MIPSSKVWILLLLTTGENGMVLWIEGQCYCHSWHNNQLMIPSLRVWILPLLTPGENGKDLWIEGQCYCHSWHNNQQMIPSSRLRILPLLTPGETGIFCEYQPRPPGEQKLIFSKFSKRLLIFQSPKIFFSHRVLFYKTFYSQNFSLVLLS
jgi:hypothetical protein